MKTMALTEDTVPSVVQSKVASVVARSLPQSSAFTIRHPVAAGGSGPMSTDGVDKTQVGAQAAAAFLLDTATNESPSTFIS